MERKKNSSNICGKKGKHRTQARDDAVTDKARGPIRSANSGEQAAHCLRQCSINQIADEIAQPRAERAKGDIEHSPMHREEQRDRKVFIGDNFIHPVRYCQVPILMAFFDGLLG